MAEIISYDEFVKFSKKEQRDCLHDYLGEKLTEENRKFYAGTGLKESEIKMISLDARVYEEHGCYVYGQIFFNVNKYDFDIPGEDILLRCFTSDSLDMSVKEQAEKHADSWNELHEDIKLVYLKERHTYNAMLLFSLDTITKNEISYNDFMQNIVSRMILNHVQTAGKALEGMCFEHYLLSYDRLLLKRDRYGIMEYFEIKGFKSLKKYDQDTDELEIKMPYRAGDKPCPTYMYLSNGNVRFQIHCNNGQLFEKTIPEDEEAAEVIEETILSLAGAAT